MVDKDAPLGSEENPEVIDMSKMSGADMDAMMVEMANLSEHIKTPDHDGVTSQNLPLDGVEKDDSGKTR